MKNFSALLSCMFIVSCTAATNSEQTDSTYGFTEKNAIKVGGVTEGPLNQRAYLNSLTGPNGEEVYFERSGSCCQFKTSKGFLGSVMLDRYAVTYQGKKDTVYLYLNMYDSGKLKAPVGFKMK